LSVLFAIFSFDNISLQGMLRQIFLKLKSCVDNEQWYATNAAVARGEATLAVLPKLEDFPLGFDTQGWFLYHGLPLAVQ
jgi:hypothetical protein